MDDVRLRAALEVYYQQVKAVILDKQHPVTGLLPASTAVTVHGDYRDAWVRDNVYSILAVWGLALAYRNIDDDGGRGFELEHSTIKLMRGLLRAMMRQSHKVEAFKKTQAREDALHAKYDTVTGGVVVADDAWGHLQIDATSLFLLTLAQMIASGLDIISTLDEVNFVQNLVFYIDRAYRTPDYGIWERGEKMNRGGLELNASSLGMAKAALEALSGFNLFGARGSQASVVHVIPDNIAQAGITLRSLLPRESSTKEVDAALLSVISFPAFAVNDPALVSRVREEIVHKLEGRYGLKRFLRDGHQTVLEDDTRLHYQAEELKQFEDIESEWPLFFTYLFLDGLFRGDADQVTAYARKLNDVLVDQDGYELLPELFFVPEDRVDEEKEQPHSQERQSNDNIPLVWAQSLYLLGRLLQEGYLQPSDIDPLGRHQPVVERRPVVQLVVLAEDEALKAELATHGVLAETPQALFPVEVRFPDEVAAAYEQVGRNDKLGLTGRPLRRMKSMSTSRLYRLGGKTVVCLSPFFMQREFYLAFDMDFLVARFKSELAYIHRHWAQLGRPTVTILLTHSLLESGENVFYALMQQVRTGHVEGIPVKAGRLAQLMPTACFERIDDLHNYVFEDPILVNLAESHTVLLQRDFHCVLPNTAELEIELEHDVDALIGTLESSANLYEQVEILAALARLQGLEHVFSLRTQNVTVRQLLEEVYEQAGRRRLWAVVRRAASLLGKFDVDLFYAVGAILVRQKNVLLGRAYSKDSLIDQPIPPDTLLDKINTYCRDDIRDRVLTQEILVYLGLLIKAKPELFADLLTIRVSYLILLLTSELGRDLQLTQDEAYEHLMHMAPSNIQKRLRGVLEHYQNMGLVIEQMESLRAQQPESRLTWAQDEELEALQAPPEGWFRWRQYRGILNRVPENLYARIWRLFEHTQGLIIGEKLERRNRLDSRVVLSDMTPGEKDFALRIEHLLNKLPSPEYRHLNLEALTVLSRFAEQNPSLKVDGYLVLDVLIGHAVRLAYIDKHPAREATYNEHKADAWTLFHARPPVATTEYMIKAFRYLLDYGTEATPELELHAV